MKQFFKTHFSINRILLIACIITMISNIIKIQESKRLSKQVIIYSKHVQKLDTIVKSFTCEVDTFTVKVDKFSKHAQRYLKAIGQ